MGFASETRTQERFHVCNHPFKGSQNKSNPIHIEDILRGDQCERGGFREEDLESAIFWFLPPGRGRISVVSLAIATAFPSGKRTPQTDVLDGLRAAAVACFAC